MERGTMEGLQCGAGGIEGDPMSAVPGKSVDPGGRGPIEKTQRATCPLILPHGAPPITLTNASHFS